MISTIIDKIVQDWERQGISVSLSNEWVEVDSALTQIYPGNDKLVLTNVVVTEDSLVADGGIISIVSATDCVSGTPQELLRLSSSLNRVFAGHLIIKQGDPTSTVRLEFVRLSPCIAN